jgi:MOSC domain-containing protein YiiM
VFLNQPHCGVYVRVLTEGRVIAGDHMILKRRMQEKFTMARIYWLRYNAEMKDLSELDEAIGLDSLAASAKRGLSKRRDFLK